MRSTRSPGIGKGDWPMASTTTTTPRLVSSSARARVTARVDGRVSSLAMVTTRQASGSMPSTRDAGTVTVTVCSTVSGADGTIFSCFLGRRRMPENTSGPPTPMPSPLGMSR